MGGRRNTQYLGRGIDGQQLVISVADNPSVLHLARKVAWRRNPVRNDAIPHMPQQAVPHIGLSGHSDSEDTYEAFVPFPLQAGLA
jgi:hypothetical protein